MSVRCQTKSLLNASDLWGRRHKNTNNDNKPQISAVLQSHGGYQAVLNTYGTTVESTIYKCVEYTLLTYPE